MAWGPKKSLPSDSDRILALLEAAIKFVPPERAEALFRKWLAGINPTAMPELRRLEAVADSVLLAGDLLLSQPSALGSTAFDRLAKSRAGDRGPDAPLLEALRKARFRLLRLEQPSRGPLRIACDVLSGEALRLRAEDFALLAADMVVFTRVAKLPDELYYAAGPVTPLDQAALAAARGHGSAGATGVFASARWAEAVYAHVVRHGTLSVPGVNRPGNHGKSDDPLGDADDALNQLARRWVALGGAAPDAALLDRTRKATCQHNIIDALRSTIETRAAGQTARAAAFERLLMVMMETILHRERGGSGNLTLDMIAQHIETGIAHRCMPRDARTLFVTLRQRIVGTGAARGLDDPDLARLMQRIQALRAKTVSHGCTEQEALAAAEKVAELLDRYGLSLGELDFKAQPCDGVGIQTTRKRFAPIDNCIPTIAEFFDCRVWLESAKGNPLRYVFFGVRTDVAAAQYLYELVERAFETETNMFRAGDLYAAMEGERRSATTSFQVGLSHGICDKLRAIQAARDAHRRSASGRDLVLAKAAVVDEEMAKLGLDLHKRGVSGSRRVLSDAFAAGQQAAERFEYTPGIGRAA